MIPNKNNSTRAGFTIVELLVVIIVIGILATIGFIYYSGMQERAREAVLRSDLTAAAEILNVDQVRTGSYPDDEEKADRGNGLPASADTEYQYDFDNSVTPPTFCLTGINGPVALYITQEGRIQQGTCEGHVGPIAGGGDESECSSLPDMGLGIRDYKYETVVTSSEHTSRSPVSTDVAMPDAKDGDLVLIHVAWDGGGIITDARFIPPEGFQPLAEWMGDDSFLQSVLWWGIADCLPSSLSVNIRHTLGVQNQISVITVSGVQPNEPVVAVDGLVGDSYVHAISTILSTPSTVPVSASGIDLRIGYTRTEHVWHGSSLPSNETWTPPSGYAEIFDFNAPSASPLTQATFAAYRVLTSNSPTGIRNFTASGSSPKHWAGYTITLAEQ